MRHPSLVLVMAVLVGSSVVAGCGDDDGVAPGTDAGTSDGAVVGDGGAGSDGGGAECTGRPSAAPMTRGELTGALDATHGRIIVYGGNIAAPVMCIPSTMLVDETWAFHLDCNSWEQLAPDPSPGVRARHATTVDTTRDRMIVFGGRRRAGTTSYTLLNDVWAFDFATDTWEQLVTTGTGPTPRWAPTAVYDSVRDRVLVFGGNPSTDSLSYTGSADLFALDVATGAWSRITATGGPSARLFHAAVAVDRQMVVYGGTNSFDGPFFGDTYAFDMDADTWARVAASGPDVRFGAQVYGDAAGGRMILVAGHDGTNLGNRNDMHALDLASGTWTELHPGDTPSGMAAGMCDFPADFTTPEEGAPERRYSFVAAQDATTGYVFGGKTDCGNVNDVWAFPLDTGAWTKLRPSTGGEACNRTGATSCTTLCF